MHDHVANWQIMAYDDEERLTSWQNAPSSPTSIEAMAYDGDGNRVALVVNGGTPTYYLGNLEVISGSSLTEYFTACAGLPTIERVGTSGALYYLASDGLDSMNMALGSNGTVTAQQLYFSFGRPYYSSGTMPTAKGFTGQQMDSATSGIIYFNARYYDYVSRQFLSADFVPDGLNQYAYVHWNPETDNDPSGHCLPVCLITAAIGAAVGAGIVYVPQLVSNLQHGGALNDGHTWTNGVNWGNVAKGALIGAAVGATGGAAWAAVTGAGAGALGASLLGAAEGAANGWRQGDSG